MELFRLTLPGLQDGTAGLYYREAPETAGAAKQNGSSLVFSSRAAVSFDTFFNLFSHAKYLRFTRVSEAELRLSLSGRFRVRLFHKYEATPSPSEKKAKRKKKKDGEPEELPATLSSLIAEEEFDSAVKKEFSVRFSLPSVPAKGFICFELTAYLENSTFYGGCYATGAEPKPTRVGIVVCTYKREDYVKRNMASLAAYLSENPAIAERFAVFIIDNGNTLNGADFPAFATVFPNKNLGGSGGFTRGIMEVSKRKDEFTHFLLMDDDIIFEPEVLNKTFSFLSVLKDECKAFPVGAVMLPFDKPTAQQEFGAYWTGIRICHNLHFLDLSAPVGLLKNEKEYSIDYNGWWFHCMPVSAVEKIGLPLPLFIKIDDVEYSLRYGEKIILLNGLGVWHEGFDQKPADWQEYYIKRNELITCAIHSNGRTMFKNFWKAVKFAGKALMKQRYYQLDMVFKAYDDFLKGPEYLMHLDGEENHKKIISGSPALLDEQALYEKYGFVYSEEELKKRKTEKRHLLARILTCNGYLLPRLFFERKYKTAPKVVDIQESRGANFYRADHVIQFHPALKKGFATRLKKTELWKTFGRLLRLWFRMLFGYRQVVRKWHVKEHNLLINCKELLKVTLDINA